MKIRTHARIAAIVLLALAAAGFWAWEWRVVFVFYHVGVSLLFLYVGFLLEDTKIAPQIVGGPGVLPMVVKATDHHPDAADVGRPRPPRAGRDNLPGGGESSVLVARYLPDDRPGRS